MVRRKDKKGRVLEKGESQRKDGLYVFQYNDLYGTRKSIYEKDLNELRKRKKQILRDLEDMIDTKGAEITLNEQFDKYMSLKCQIANTTRQNYMSLWNNNVKNNPLGNKRLCDIKRTDIIKLYNNIIDRGLKCSTLKILHQLIFSCIEMAVNDDIIRKNPSKNCIRDFNTDSDEKKSLTPVEQEKLLEFLKNSKYAIYYPMIAFAISTALRCGEITGLTWNDVNFKNKEISINHQLLYKKVGNGYQFYIGAPKTESGIRVIPLTNYAINLLKEQRENQLALGYRTDVVIDGYKDFVFSTRNKKPLTPSSVNKTLESVIKKYNLTHEEHLPHISSHILRHTGCTRMAEAGIDIKVLQYIMGHSNIAVTMNVYNHASMERNHNEMKKMENIRLIS